MHNPNYVKDLLVDDSRHGVVVNRYIMNILLNLSEGKIKFTQLDERIITDHIDFIFHKNNFMYKAFDRKLVQMIEGGIAERNVGEYDSRYKYEEPEGGPVVLTLSHLGVGFQFWLVFLIICVAFFVLELVWLFIVEKIVHRSVHRSINDIRREMRIRNIIIEC